MIDIKQIRHTIVRSDMTAEVVQSSRKPEEWAVEAVDDEGDGAVYMVTFSGPFAKDRAVEYAAIAFDRFQIS